jgi:hypothetical protein
MVELVLERVLVMPL